MFVTIIILLWIWICVVNWRNGNFSDEGAVVGPILSGAFAALIILIASIPAQMYCKVETGRTDCNGNIYSLRNQEGFQGNFFLGSGYVGSYEYYYMFQKDERGGFFRVSLSSGECFLFERDEKPHLSWQMVHYRLPSWYIFWPQFTWQKRTKYDIIVPPKTVVERFQVQ